MVGEKLFGEYKLNEEKIEEILVDFTPEKNQYLRKQFLQRQDYAKVLDFLEPFEKGNLMEVGSYAGVFLNDSRLRGWNVLGIEPMDFPRIYAERNFGINVLPDPFEDSEIEPESQDVICSFHVIEHIYEPEVFLRKVNSILKKGGILILETPTYDSLMFKILKHRERSIRCNGHLFFFTRKTLRQFMEKYGFVIIKHERVGRTLSAGRLFYNLGVITGMKKFFETLTKILNLEKSKIHLNMRDIQRIYCKKID
jgi:2-polyprenyl-3-methyl-5-hydroxy-6-metoxy-1,4-benzoquinol methylase